MDRRTPKLVATGVFVASITSLVIVFSLFFSMWLQGQRSITLYADVFGEFWVEFVGLSLAIIFMPVLLYELDQLIFKQ